MGGGWPCAASASNSCMTFLSSPASTEAPEACRVRVRVQVGFYGEDLNDALEASSASRAAWSLGMRSARRGEADARRGLAAIALIRSRRGDAATTP